MVVGFYLTCVQFPIVHVLHSEALWTQSFQRLLPMKNTFDAMDGQNPQMSHLLLELFLYFGCLHLMEAFKQFVDLL